MKVAIVIPPKDFKDETVALAKMMLEKWGVTPVITSYTAKDCVGYHGAVYKPDMNTSKVEPSEYDALLLVNGVGVEGYKLYEFRPLLDLVKGFVTNKKIVAAIGNSIKILTKTNVITDVAIATPDDEDIKRNVRIYRGEESADNVEFDKNILTAKGDEDLDKFVDTLLQKLGAK